MMQITPTFLIRVLQARWRLGLIASLSAAFLFGLVSYFFPSSYVASATIMLDTKADPVANPHVSSSASAISTEAEMIKSQIVRKKVVQDLSLMDHPVLKAQYDQAFTFSSYPRWLKHILVKHLVVEPIRSSGMIIVSFANPDASTAALIANGYASAFVQTSLALRIERAEKYSAFFDERSKVMRANVERAQAKLIAYQKKADVLNQGDKPDMELAKLNALQEQLVRIQSSLFESKSQQTTLVSAVSPSRIQDGESMLSGIRQEIVRQEAKFGELSGRFDENHPQIQELKKVLASLRGRQTEELARVSAMIEKERMTNKRREAELRQAYEAQRERVFAMGMPKNELVSLQKELEAEQRAYDAVMQRFAQLSMERSNNLPSATLFGKAELPDEPQKSVFLMGNWKAIVLGLMALGVAAAFFRELFDRRVHSAEDIELQIDLPVIGTLPAPDARLTFLRRKLVPAVQQSRLLRHVASNQRV